MPAADELTVAEETALRDQCTVFLAGHGPVTAAALLASIPADTVVDRYGEGGAVAELEEEIGGLLGKQTAVFVPSGTMAQQSVLRVHADRRQRRTVVFHPMCHLDRHEGQAYQRLHALTGRPAGDPDRLLTIGDLTAISEPPAALLIELPQRDLGGQQPELADLTAQLDWARNRGAAVHLDGARLWESAAGYGKPVAEIPRHQRQPAPQAGQRRRGVRPQAVERAAHAVAPLPHLGDDVRGPRYTAARKRADAFVERHVHGVEQRRYLGHRPAVPGG